jgi:hypothetical protein
MWSFEQGGLVDAGAWAAGAVVLAVDPLVLAEEATGAEVA